VLARFGQRVEVVLKSVMEVEMVAVSVSVILSAKLTWIVHDLALILLL